MAVMGVLNVSPESFHAGSVHTAREALLRAALAMVEAGAALLDVGARSTAPYREADTDEAEECRRLAAALEWLGGQVPVPLSADTTRPAPAQAALEAGARVINDVSGLRDPRLAALVRAHRADVILTATPVPTGFGGPASTTLAATLGGSDRRAFSGPPSEATGLGRAPEPGGDPVQRVRVLLRAALERARLAGIPEERVVLDPGIGFFRDEAVAWPEWDVRVLAGLAALSDLGRPLCVGVSRKSFVGALTGRAPAGERLAGSLAATALTVAGGAALVRTHDVAETLDAIRVAERVRRATMSPAMRKETPGP